MCERNLYRSTQYLPPTKHQLEEKVHIETSLPNSWFICSQQSLCAQVQPHLLHSPAPSCLPQWMVPEFGFRSGPASRIMCPSMLVTCQQSNYKCICAMLFHVSLRVIPCHMHPSMLGSCRVAVNTCTTFAGPGYSHASSWLIVSSRVHTQGAHGWCSHHAVLSGTQKAALECQLPLNPAQSATAGSLEAELGQRSCVAVLE